MKNKVIAICYDFDHTLSPCDMQSISIIPSFGISSEEFWKESNEMAKLNGMDTNLAWMYKIMIYSHMLDKSTTRKSFFEIGKTIPLYNGLDTWFDNINQYGLDKGITVEHYVISSGLKEIIEGTSIASKITRIYASTYLYSSDGVAIWPAQAVNYTNKTQFLFRISKGYFDECDSRVNDLVSQDKVHVPFENMIYIGDSATDIPCMKLVKKYGGCSIGVYDTTKNNPSVVGKLFDDGRLSCFAPANYEKGSDLYNKVCEVIDSKA